MLVWLKLVAFPFLKAHFETVVVVSLIAGYTAFIYHEGGKADRETLLSERAQNKAEAARLVAEQGSRKEESDAFIGKLEGEHKGEVARVNEEWEAFASALCPGGVDARGVCRGTDGRGRAAQPARADAGVPVDASCGDRLQSSLLDYLEAERLREAGERAQTARLLEAAESQTDALVKAQVYARGERAIHGGFGMPR